MRQILNSENMISSTATHHWKKSLTLKNS